MLEKVLQYDERTCCMKPDLRITINVEAVDTKGKLRSHTGNLLLRKVFRSRVLEFFKSHPEVQLVLHLKLHKTHYLEFSFDLKDFTHLDYDTAQS